MQVHVIVVQVHVIVVQVLASTINRFYLLSLLPLSPVNYSALTPPPPPHLHPPHPAGGREQG